MRNDVTEGKTLTNTKKVFTEAGRGGRRRNERKGRKGKEKNKQLERNMKSSNERGSQIAI